MNIQVKIMLMLFIACAFATCKKADDYADYVIGDTGPAGGLIFYIEGSYSDGWWYLEAAQSDIGTEISGYFEWGGEGIEIGATATNIGTGAANTNAIVAVLGVRFNYPARECNELILGGYSDWFLPSRDELNLIYVNLKQRGISDFADYDYWSSSESNRWGAHGQDFADGSQFSKMKDFSSKVRAARAFKQFN